MAPPSRELTPDRSIRHLFGYQLRVKRQEREWSLERLASEAHSSRSHLARIEVAEYMPPRELPPILDQIFTTGDLFASLYALMRKEIHPDQYQRLMELEERARTVKEYAGQLVPGIVQTKEYARELIRTSMPKATAERIDELVMARMSRQELLRSDPPTELALVLDEAVLRRPIGGPAVMREQLARLIALVDTPNRAVQVVPFDHGAHALVGGGLKLMTLDDGTEVAFEESIGTGTLLEDSERVNALQWSYDLLRADALSRRESAAFIQSVMEALPT
ncbi:helix-turn-helix domain-containing protein [Streptomyces sp. NPDC000941]